MVTDQSPLHLHSGNDQVSLDAPPMDEMTEFGSAVSSIQTRK